MIGEIYSIALKYIEIHNLDKTNLEHIDNRTK